MMREEFISAAKDKDIPALRSFVTFEIINDPTFKKKRCDECMEYLKNQGINITEEYQMDSVEEPTPTDKSMWDKRLFLKKVEFLRRNFAYDDRIKELREIGPVVYAGEMDDEEPNFSKAPKGQRSGKKNTSLAMIIGAIAAAAAIIALIVALVKR